jgi:hypothetical protein
VGHCGISLKKLTIFHGVVIVWNDSLARKIKEKISATILRIIMKAPMTYQAPISVFIMPTL